MEYDSNIYFFSFKPCVEQTSKMVKELLKRANTRSDLGLRFFFKLFLVASLRIGCDLLGDVDVTVKSKYCLWL